MSAEDHTYCRLCADLTPPDNLIICQDDTYSDISEKLERINAFTDFNDEVLPKSICLTCLHSLDAAYEFVRKIEQAQQKLRTTLLKTELDDKLTSYECQIVIESFKPENKAALDIETKPQIEPKLENKSEPVLKIKEEVKTYSRAKENNVASGNLKQKPVYESENDDCEKAVVHKTFSTKSKTKGKKKTIPKDEESSSLSKTKDKKNDEESRSVTKMKVKKKTAPIDGESSWNDYIWKCTVCDTQFGSFGELKTHSIQYHNLCNAFRCVDCNIRKLRLDRFLVHVRRHRSYLKFICFICDARFKTPYKAIVHRSEHNTSKHVCPGCHANFDSVEDFTKHTSDYYQEAKMIRITPLAKRITDKLTCLLCKKTFQQKGHLNKHLLLHSKEERKKEHACDRCGKCFTTKVELTEHLMKHDNIRPFPCKICNKAFITQTQLRSHVGVHEREKPFTCEQCGRCFRLRKLLLRHKKVHLDILPHACTLCDKRFRYKACLTQHSRLHTGIKPYTCEICPRDFTNWPNYNKHMKRRHDMDMAKKKRNSDGTPLVDAATGEFMKTKECLEWKNELMKRKRAPRVNSSNTEASNTGKMGTTNYELL